MTIRLCVQCIWSKKKRGDISSDLNLNEFEYFLYSIFDGLLNEDFTCNTFGYVWELWWNLMERKDENNRNIQWIYEFENLVFLDV